MAGSPSSSPASSLVASGSYLDDANYIPADAGAADDADSDADAEIIFTTSCILAGLTSPPFTLVFSLVGKAASSIVFLTGFSSPSSLSLEFIYTGSLWDPLGSTSS